MRKNKIPIWYILLITFIFAELVYFCMIQWYIQIQNGIPISKNVFQVLNMDELAPGVMLHSMKWNEFDFAGFIVSMVLGLVCLVLGVIRAFHKLECKHLFLVAAFSLLYTAFNMSSTTLAPLLFSPEFWFYSNKFTMLYGVLLMIHFYDYLRLSVRKWMLPLIFLPLVYMAAAWVMFLGFGLSFHIPNRFYHEISYVCIALFLAVGSFAAKSKEAARYIRIIAIAWSGWIVYILIISLAGISYYIEDKLRAYMIITAAFMMCYALFANIRELVGYKSEMQMAEMKNKFLLENYQALENHFSQIAQMKHEMRHHLFAIRILFESGETEQLAEYLADLQDSFAEIEEPIPIGNRMMQAVFTHAAQLARSMDFEIKFDISPIPPLSITDTDIVGFFMNLLDNALEACENMPEGQNRFINLTISWREPYVNILCENSKAGDIQKTGGLIQSRKSGSGHGFGLKTMWRILDAYDGIMSIEYDENTFTVRAALKNK